jgi:uncharacterized protein YaiL (DUF2058 family)
MSDSLKDQLLGLGFKPVAKTDSKAASSRPESNKRQTGNPKHSKPLPVKSKSSQDIDLAKAFALRSQQDKQERERAEIEKREASERKKLAKEAVAKLLQGQILNVADADIARHFSYGGKIKRIYVTTEQLPLLNSGMLGVVQFNGRYCLVDKDVVLGVRDALPALVALYCDGSEEQLPEGYDDPQFQVPDDLVW